MMPIGSVGRSVRGGRLPDAISDIVDNLEDTPDGPYGSGETIADYYEGDLNVVERSTNNAAEGTYSLAVESGNSFAAIYSRPGDGLPSYPDSGDTLDVLIRSENGSAGVLFNVKENTDTPGCYAGIIRSDSTDFRLLKITDLTSPGDSESTLAEQSVAFDEEWYWVEITPSWSGDTTIEFTVYELEPDLKQGDEVASLSATDSDYEDERGIGWYPRGTDTVNEFGDRYRSK